MENQQNSQLERGLALVDQTLFFLVLITLSVLLSFWATLIQRRTLACALEGVTLDTARQVYLLRKAASALVIGSLGFFLCVALKAASQREENQTDRRSAQVNLWTALAVFLSAVFRLIDLDRLECNRQSAALELDVQPE